MNDLPRLRSTNTAPLVAIGFVASCIWGLPVLAQPVASRADLDSAMADRCLQILQDGMSGGEFWPAMHAAEGLTLGGHPQVVLHHLKARLAAEGDDQKRCGLARELARAGDRNAVSVLLNVLASDNPHGHVHAAESLFKLKEVGDRKALRAAYGEKNEIRLRQMAAAALARAGDEQAAGWIRTLLNDREPSVRQRSAWILAVIGDSSDLPRLREGLPRAENDRERSQFEHTLAVLGDPAGLEKLARNLSASDSSIRANAAFYAGECRNRRLAGRLQELLDDPEPDVRIRAAGSLLILSTPSGTSEVK